MFWRTKHKFGPNLKDTFRKSKTMLPLLFALLIFIFTDQVSAIPNSINYQARLRDNLGAPIAVSTTIQFSIYNHLSGGSSGDAPSSGGPLLWKETYDQASGACAQIIPDAQGYFTLTLGDCVAFPSYLDFSSGTYYLGVKISSDSESAPRVKLNAHPYALNSDRVDGFHATSTATANQLLALGDDLSFDIGAGVYSGASINLTSTTVTSSIAGNLYVAGNSTFATATIGNLIISGASSFTDISWSNATGTNLYLASNLNVAGDSYFGTIASGTWNGSVIEPAYGGTGQDTSGWTGFVKLSAGVWSTSTISLTADVSGVLPIANGGTNASSFSPYEFTWFNGTSLVGSGFSSSSFMATGTDNWVNITGDTMSGALTINSNLNVTGSSTLATTTISTLRLGDDYGFPTDAPVLVSYKQYTDLAGFEFLPAHAFLTDLNPSADSSSTLSAMISLTTNENSTTNFELIGGSFNQAIHNGSGIADVIVGSYSMAELASATGSVDLAVGIAGQVNNGIEDPSFSGSINNAVAVFAMIENGMGGGTIGNAMGLMTNITTNGGVMNNVYGVRINNPSSDSATGTVGNLYGLYIEEQNFATTSNFNIYSDGAGSVNYFGGRVGIGTSTPLYDLHLVQDRNLNAPAITFENTNSAGASSTMILNLKVGNYGGGIAVAGENFDDLGLSNIAGYTLLASAIEQTTDGNGLALLAGSNGNIIFYAGGFGPPTMDTERMRIENDGRVAIGTSSTYEMLTVAGGINIGATTTPTSTAGTIAFDGSDFIGYTGSSWLSLTAGIGGVTGSGSIGQLSFWDSASSIAGTTSLFWDGVNGYLGIGTSTPSSILHVVEDNEMWTTAQIHNLNIGPSSTAFLNVRVGENWGGGLFQASPNYSDFDLSHLAGYTILLSGGPDMQSNGLALAATEDNNILFFAGGSGPPTADTERMRIESSGFVGIGTTTPLAKLDVYGNIILSAENPYINFGSTTASSGYGFRVNNGLVEVKHLNNNHNVWSEIVTLVALTEGNTIYVSDTSGKDSFDGTSPAKAKKTINAGIGAASSSASMSAPYLVVVAPGVYNENVVMEDYMKVQGSGCNTIINGKVSFNMATGSVLADVDVKNTNDYAIEMTGSGQATLKNVIAEATYTNDTAIQAVVYVDNGSFESTGQSEFTLTRSNNAVGVRVNTAFYISGSNLVRANIFGADITVITYDGTDDLSLAYVDNTNSGSVVTIKDPIATFPIYSFAPANTIKLVYHNGSSANTYLDGGFITGITIAGGTAKVLPAYVANSGVDSGARITHTAFSWAGSGFSDSNVYLGASVSSTDKIVLVSNHFNTTADIFPVRYETDGASGTLDYFIANGYGNLQNRSFSTYDGSFGIGTSTPYDRLEVWGEDLSSSPTSSRNYITVVANGNGEAGNYIRRVNSGVYDNGWSWYMPTSSLDLRLWDDSIGAEGDDVFTIQGGTGHIGIGTALYEPLNLLHVDGGLYLGDTATATSTYSIYNVGGDLYWNGNLLASAGGATANWQLVSHNGADALSTSTTIPVWFKDVIYASSSLYVDGILSVLGSASLATTTMTSASANYLVVNNTVTTTDLIATGYITLGGVARNTWPSGGGGDSSWATTTANVMYPSLTPPYAVVIGASVTSSNVIFEVVGDSYMSGDLEVGGSLTVGDNFQADYFTAVSTTAVSYLGGGLVLGDPNATGITGYERIILSDEIGAFSDFSFKVAGGVYPVLNLGSSAGTTVAPTLKGTGSYGGLDFYGYDGANWQKSGGIIGQTDGTPALNSMPGKIVFSTTPNGSTTALERMAIDSRGWVGMGTTTPGAPLHVVTATSGPAMTILQKTIAGATNLNFVTNNNKYWQLSKRDGTENDKFRFYFVNDAGVFNNVFTLGATGTVGINNDNPDAMLSIAGTSSYPLLNIMTSSSATGMYVSNIGNVGIGTTDPNYYKLRVYSDDSDVTAEIKTASSSKMALFNLKAGDDVNVLQLGYYGSTTPGFAGIPPASAVWDSVAPGGSYFINEASGAPLVFMTDGWQTENERMRITAEGFVGIGTSTPLSKLHIDYGDIRISTGTESWIAGPNAFPNRAGSTGLIGLNMIANSSTWNSGLFTEVDGRLLSHGINVTQLGDRNTSTIGAIFRLDTRDNTPYWSIKRQSVGGSTEYSDMQIAQTGEIGFGGHANDTNIFAGQVHVLSAASTTVGFAVQGAVGQTAALQQWLNSAGTVVGEAKNLSQNFGMSLETGALIQLNSYFGEEYSRNRANRTADGVYIWGDFQQFAVDENGTCAWSIINNEVNGIGRQQAAAGNSCLSYYGSAVGTAHDVFSANNLPVILSKIRPSADSATARSWVGIGDIAVAQTTDPTNGIYFTNNTATGDWRGITRRAGSSTNVECTGQTVDNSVFAVTKIEVVSSNGDGTGSVKFYIDNDTSNGIDWTYCGESTTNIPTVGLTALLMNYSTALHNLYVDYWRVWQDDSAEPLSPVVLEEEEIVEELTIEERVAILEEFDTNITSDFELMAESVNVLDVALSETQAMLDEMNNRVSILENNDITTGESIIDLSNMMTDFDLRLNELASSSAGLQLTGEAFDSLTANVLVINDSALFNGTLAVKKHITFGEDTVGQGMILAGHTSTTVTFAEPYDIAPIINITPIDFDDKWKLSEVSTSGFKIMINEVQIADTLFNWQAIGVTTDSKIFVSDGTINPIGLIIEYVPEPPIEEPVIEEPVIEEPPIEEPIVEEPIVEEPPVAEAPIEEPVIEEPVIEEPPIEEPVVEEPPVAEAPVIAESPIEEPPVIEPPAEEPSAETPLSPEPPIE